MSSNSSVVSVTVPSGPIIDPQTGQPSFAFTKWLQAIANIANTSFTTQGTLSGESIPYPTADTLGGVVTAGPVASQWINQIDDEGVPHLSQPGFSDLAGAIGPSQVPPLSQLRGSVTSAQVPQLSQLNGAVTPSQVPLLSALNGSVKPSQLPFPTTTSIGGVEAVAAIAHEWVNAISTSGIPSLSRPAVADVTGAAPLASPTFTGTATAPIFSATSGLSSTNTGTASYYAAISALYPNLASGNYGGITVGASANSNYNSAIYMFQNIGGAGSTSNAVAISVYGGQPIKLNGLGVLSVPSGLTVNGYSAALLGTPNASYLAATYLQVNGSLPAASPSQGYIDFLTGNTRFLSSGSSSSTYGSFQWIGLTSNGAAYQAASLNGATGAFTATTKNFTIPYPGDPTKLLVHSCVEGPEIAVYYRGQAQLVNGVATITLPDYFEALTLATGRTVLLTPQFQSATDAISQLAASIVANGQFSIRAIDTNNPSQYFYWEVKAVRSDQPALAVVVVAPPQTNPVAQVQST